MKKRKLLSLLLVFALFLTCSMDYFISVAETGDTEEASESAEEVSEDSEEDAAEGSEAEEVQDTSEDTAEDTEEAQDTEESDEEDVSAAAAGGTSGTAGNSGNTGGTSGGTSGGTGGTADGTGSGSSQTTVDYDGNLYHIDIRVEGTFTYVSSFTAENETIATVSKVWDDNKDHSGETLTVYLLDEDGNVLLDDDGNERTVELSEENGWTATLDTTDVYGVLEEELEGYETTYSQTTISEEESSYYESEGKIEVESINYVQYSNTDGEIITLDGSLYGDEGVLSENGVDYEFFCEERSLEGLDETCTIWISITFTYSYTDENGKVQSDTITKIFEFSADEESNDCANLTANSDDDSSNDIYDITMYGYDAVISFELDDILTESANQAVTITNTISTYDLTLSKTVEGTDKDESFVFTVYIGEAGEYEADIVTADGVTSTVITIDETGLYTFELKSGESVTIYDIPYGTEYYVSENDYRKYDTSSSVTEGEETTDYENGTNRTITADTAVSYTNTYDYVELEYEAGISLTKIFTADTDISSSFSFLVKAIDSDTVTAEEAAEKISNQTISTSELSLSEDNGYSASETLSVFDTILFTEDDSGKTFSYQISEVISDEDGFTYDEEVYTVSFYVSFDEDKKVISVTITITDSEGNIVDDIIFENEYENPYVGSIQISKTVVAGESVTENDLQDDTFVFVITATDADGNYLNGTYGDYTFTDGVLTLYLKSGSTVTITNLPEGTKYTVTEVYVLDEATDEETGSTSYTNVDIESSGYDVTVNGEEGTDASGTIQTDVTDTYEYLNTYNPDPGYLENAINIYKSVEGREWTDSDYFTFTITALTEGAPDAEISEIILSKDNQDGYLGAITFTKTGTYEYLVTETYSSAEDLITSSAQYKLVVTVTADGEYLVVNVERYRVVSDTDNEEYTVVDDDADFSNYYVSEEYVGLLVRKVDYDNTLAVVEGAVYELYDSEGNLIAEITTDESGYGEIQYLSPGDYTLVEIKAADGYYVNGETYEITLTEEQLGTVVTYVVNDTEIDILPSTGEGGILGILILSFLFMCVVSTAGWRRRYS